MENKLTKEQELAIYHALGKAFSLDDDQGLQEIGEQLIERFNKDNSTKGK